MAEKSAAGAALELHGKPELGSRFGKRATLVVCSVAFLALGLIIYGTSTRGQGGGLFGKKDDGNRAFAPAIDTGKSLIQKVPDGVSALTGLQQSLAAEREARARAEEEARAAEARAAAQRNVPAMAPAGNPAMTPEQLAAEQRRQMREAALRSAMAADTGSGSFSSGGVVAQAAEASTLRAQEHGAALAAGNLPVPPSLGEEDQNRQAAKEAFLEKAAKAGKVSGADTLQGTRRLALSPYEIKAATVIPAVLLTGLNSDLPGNLIGQVSENVFDTATGTHLLIPQGTRLFGIYDSHVVFGQERGLVAWQRLIYPDGSSLNLEGMNGTDQSGYSGFADQVNHHYGRLIGSVVLSSLFGVAYQMTQKDQAWWQAPSSAQAAGAEVGRQVSQLGVQMAKKNLNIQPTIEIRPGYKFNVMVNKDMVFKEAYGHRTPSR